ncbi:hypothetical protein D3C71_1966840 [compost metagenome]
MVHDELELVGIEEAFQQQDRGTDTRCAQLQRFFDAGHGKAIGFVGQGVGAAHGAVAVGVGLDYRECATATGLTGQSVVMAQAI